MEKKILGIDLGGTTTKFAIVTQQGEIEDQWVIDTDISEEGSKIVPNIVQSINERIRCHDLTSDDFLGIGMGSPGTVNRAAGTVIGAYNLNWKTLQPVRKKIEEQTGISFFIDNDANVAALGEQWVGAGNKEPNVVFITLGTGVGGGIILDGQLIHGAIDAAGEIGHVTIDKDGYDCTCGKRGCLETVASATGIVRLARDRVSSFSGKSILFDELRLTKNSYSDQVDAKRIFDLAKLKDAYAEMIVDEYTHYLGYALANIANLLNPSTIVLGGGVSYAGEFLLEKVRAVVYQYTFPTIRDITKIELAQLGNDAGLIGAASLVLNEID